MVESPVRWFGALPPAFWAHRESVHGCVRSVVWDLPQKGETRSAVGACGERVRMASAGGEHLPKTVVAYAAVRGDGCPVSTFPRTDDGESFRSDVFPIDPLDGIYLRQRREFSEKDVEDSFDIVTVDYDVGTVVADRTGSPGLHGCTVHGRSESDTLNGSPDHNLHGTTVVRTGVLNYRSHG